MSEQGDHPSNQFRPWHLISRVILFGYGLLLSLFALDIDPTASVAKVSAQALVHLLPALIVFYWFLVSFRSARLAGVGIAVTSLLFTVAFGTYDEDLAFLFISVPPMVASLLLLNER